MIASQRARRQELPALTGIRFYAALFVFLSHIVAIPGMDTLAGSNQLFNSGVVGVSLFFVLSGFILTYNYSSFESGVRAADYRLFVWDRWARIYPVHIAAMLMILPIQIFSPNLPLDWRAVPFHALLAQCWWPVTKPVFYEYLNVPSWSISCEWFFYLVAPLAICCVLRGGRRLALLLGGVGLYLAVLWTWLAFRHDDFARLYLVSWFAPSRLPEFLTGVFLARAFLRRPDGAGKRFTVAAQFAGIALIVAGAFYRRIAPWPFWGGLLYVPGSALLVFGLAHAHGPLVRHLSRPFVRRLGMASFCLYLLQAPMIRGMRGVCMVLGWHVGSWPVFWAAAAIMFLAVQAAAMLMHRRYEAPLEKRLRKAMREPGGGEGYRPPAAMAQGNL